MYDIANMKYQILILLFVCCLGHSLHAQRDSILADSLYAKAKDFYYDGEFEAAQPLFQQALAVKKKFYGPEHEEIVWNYRRLARLTQPLKPQAALLTYATLKPAAI